MKPRNEAKYNSIDYGFFPFSDAPKSMWGWTIITSFCVNLRENQKTTPN